MSDPTRYEVMINVAIVDRAAYNSGGLRVEERFDVSATDFMAVAAILGRFHELAEKLRGEHADDR
jgi:hypothetical protein